MVRWGAPGCALAFSSAEVNHFMTNSGIGQLEMMVRWHGHALLLKTNPSCSAYTPAPSALEISHALSRPPMVLKLIVKL